jgi:hypothetical protein
MLARNTFDIGRHTVAGIYLGQASVLRADASMIERVFGKIVNSPNPALTNRSPSRDAGPGPGRPEP